MLLDANIPFETQDLRIADLAEREGRAVVIAVNKWDLVEDPQARLAALKRECTRLLPQLKGVPLVALSAASGKGLDRLQGAWHCLALVKGFQNIPSKTRRWLDALRPFGAGSQELSVQTATTRRHSSGVGVS